MKPYVGNVEICSVQLLIFRHIVRSIELINARAYNWNLEIYIYFYFLKAFLSFNQDDYVNDLPEGPRHYAAEYYVDNTKLFVSFNLHDSQRIVQEMKEVLLHVRDRCCGNRLLLNPDKTISKLYEFHLSLLGKDIISAFSERPRRNFGSELNIW